MSPTMAAGVSDRLWDIADIVALVEAAEAKPAKRGTYKKRVERAQNMGQQARGTILLTPCLAHNRFCGRS
jgi:hypothetical protein